MSIPIKRLVPLQLLVCAASILSAQTILNPTDNLQNAVFSAAPGATLLLNPGTYSVPAGLVVNKALTIRNNQSTRPVIQVSAGTVTTVLLSASGITFQGINIVGGHWGFYVGDPSGGATSNIAIRDVNVDTNPSASVPGHGVYVSRVANAIVDNVIVVDAYANGILVDNFSDNSIITNNTIQSTTIEHGIAVKNCSGVTVAGNTITSSGFHGILLLGAQNGRVVRNIVSGVRHDGITLTNVGARYSTGNYIGNNTASSGKLTGVGEGTGLWLNSESNGNLVYANSSNGFPENGLSIFNSSYNHVFGNVTWDNSQGGLFVYGPVGLSYSVGPAPSYNVLQSNYAFNLPVNSGINLRQSSFTTAFDNFIQGIPGGSSGGVFLQTTTNNRVFENTLTNTQTGLYFYADAATSAYFLNRHLTAMQHFDFAPSSVILDGGPVFRGNFWVGHNAANPYTNIIFNQTGATGGPFQRDLYPHANDTLTKTASVTMLYPTAGTYAAIGSRKTIEWRSSGCTYVDIYYQSGGTGLVNIASNYPDVGVFRWTVPNLPQASDYTIYIDCKNSTNQSLNANGRSGAFTIAKVGLELLTPQGNERVSAGGQAVVAWKRTSAVTAVDVLYRSGTGVFSTVLASNITANNTTVTVPNSPTSQGSFLVRASNDNAIADSSDGFVNVRGGALGAAQVMAPTGNLQIGTLRQVEWTSPVNSQYVDVSYLNSVGAAVPLVQTFPDFGRFTFLVGSSRVDLQACKLEYSIVSPK